MTDGVRVRGSGSARKLAPIFGSIILQLLACHPYGDQFQGEFNAGSVDPINFPPGYRTTFPSTAVPAVTGFTREVAGTGVFTESRAFAHGAPGAAKGDANFFRFPFPPTLVLTTGFAPPAATANPLNLPATVPVAFQFDPGPLGAPVTDSTACKAAPGYHYNPVTDDMHYDQQSHILSALPSATFNQGAPPTWTYQPVVQRESVTSNGEACQGPKSDVYLVKHDDVKLATKPDALGNPTPVPDANAYMAWAVIDPGSSVQRVNPTSATGGAQANDPTKGPCTATATTCNGIGVQHFGWYKQFVAAYVEGGAIHLDAANKMVAMNLYFPRTAPAGIATGLGAGNDVVQGVRGIDPDCAATPAGATPAPPSCYSPICRVFSYVVPAGSTAAARSVAEVLTMDPAPTPAAPISAATGQITPTFVWCLQAQ